MFEHLTVNQVANELCCKNYYYTVAYDFIVEAVECAKKDLGYANIYPSDVQKIDKYIRENYI